MPGSRNNINNRGQNTHNPNYIQSPECYAVDMATAQAHATAALVYATILTGRKVYL